MLSASTEAILLILLILVCIALVLACIQRGFTRTKIVPNIGGGADTDAKPNPSPNMAKNLDVIGVDDGKQANDMISAALRGRPLVHITGPQGVGKSTMKKELGTGIDTDDVYVDLTKKYMDEQPKQVLDYDLLGIQVSRDFIKHLAKSIHECKNNVVVIVGVFSYTSIPRSLIKHGFIIQPDSIEEIYKRTMLREIDRVANSAEKLKAAISQTTKGAEIDKEFIRIAGLMGSSLPPDYSFYHSNVMRIIRLFPGYKMMKYSEVLETVKFLLGTSEAPKS